jgi:hypothetical protein
MTGFGGVADYEKLIKESTDFSPLIKNQLLFTEIGTTYY